MLPDNSAFGQSINDANDINDVNDAKDHNDNGPVDNSFA